MSENKNIISISKLVSTEYGLQNVFLDRGIEEGCLFEYAGLGLCLVVGNTIKKLKTYIICRYSYKNGEYDYSNTYTDDDIVNNPDYAAYLNTIKYYNEECMNEHSNIGISNDDVIVTGESEDYYWVVWFDQDVSDCSLIKLNKTHFINRESFDDSVYYYLTKECGYYTSVVNNPKTRFKF